MRVLALDTASPGPALALLELRDEAPERTFVRPLPPWAAESIPFELSALLSEAGLSPRDLSRVAVLSGPGSFTGLRAGIAFARGLARALDAPFVLIGTFTAAAAALPEPTPALLVLDAGRGEVHLARYDGRSLDPGPAPVPAADARAETANGHLLLVDLASLSGSLALAAARLAAAEESQAPEAPLAYGRRSAAEEKLDGGRT